MSGRGLALVVLVASAGLLSVWIGLYGGALIALILGGWFGYELMNRAELDLSTLGLVCVEASLILAAFALAFRELGADISDATMISFQNLFHFNVITIAPGLEGSPGYRILTGLQAFLGYVLVVSGVAFLVTGRKRKG